MPTTRTFGATAAPSSATTGAATRPATSNTWILSNEHLVAEVARLRDHNGVLLGPACGACGRRYLDALGEFVLNGVNGKVGARPRGERLIHKPCQGQKGARFTVSPEHVRQKDRSDNIEILTRIVDKAAINTLRRSLEPATGKREVGIARVYDRIFWLERVLLAYERAQLAQWRARLAKAGEFRHTRIAHDDIVLSVNWETKADNKITPLHCSVSADIASGYVFRIDMDFDPTVDPVALLEQVYINQLATGQTLRRTYTQASGRTFTAPLLAFQRETGRFDEAALFSSAVMHLRLFAVRTEDAIQRSGAPADLAVLATIQDARTKANILETLGERYFNFGAPEREGRSGFTGIMTRDTCTKGASLLCLKEMLPDGKLTLAGEQEAPMARVVPHIFREEIGADRFEWHVVAFEKEVKKPRKLSHTNS